ARLPITFRRPSYTKSLSRGLLQQSVAGLISVSSARSRSKGSLPTFAVPPNSHLLWVCRSFPGGGNVRAFRRAGPCIRDILREHNLKIRDMSSSGVARLEPDLLSHLVAQLCCPRTDPAWHAPCPAVLVPS